VAREIDNGKDLDYEKILLLNPYISSLALSSSRPVQQGQICSFDGINDFVDITHSTNLNRGSGNFKIVGWFKTSTKGQIIWDKRYSTSGDTSGIVIFTDGTKGSIRALIYHNNMTNRLALESTNAYDDGNWHSFELEITDSDDGTLTVDGTDTDTGNDPLIVPDTPNSLYLGGARITSGIANLQGSIFNIRVEKDGVITAQYNLNHVSGTTAYDSSGNGNDGTLTNGAAFVVDNTIPHTEDKLNLEGFTDDGGVLKPRDESDPSKDIDGNPLQYSGSVYPVPPLDLGGGDRDGHNIATGTNPSPASDGHSNFDLILASDTHVGLKATDPANTVFLRESDGLLLMFSEPLTGGNLALVESYTS